MAALQADVSGGRGGRRTALARALLASRCQGQGGKAAPPAVPAAAHRALMIPAGVPLAETCPAPPPPLAGRAVQGGGGAAGAADAHAAARGGANRDHGRAERSHLQRTQVRLLGPWERRESRAPSCPACPLHGAHTAVAFNARSACPAFRSAFLEPCSALLRAPLGRGRGGPFQCSPAAHCATACLLLPPTQAARPASAAHPPPPLHPCAFCRAAGYLSEPEGLLLKNPRSSDWRQVGAA